MVCQPPLAACRLARQNQYARHASGSSPRHLQLLTLTSHSPPMVRIALKHWQCTSEPPSSCSHHMLAHLRNARIVCCGENGKVGGGDKEGSSSQGCLLVEVNPPPTVCGGWETKSARRHRIDLVSLSARCADLLPELVRFTRFASDLDGYVATSRRRATTCVVRPRARLGGTESPRLVLRLCGVRARKVHAQASQPYSSEYYWTVFYNNACQTSIRILHTYTIQQTARRASAVGR